VTSIAVLDRTKQFQLMKVTEAGTQKEFNEQPAKLPASRRSIRQFASKVTSDSALHPLNEFMATLSKETGSRMDGPSKQQPQNASHPISDNFELGSNVNEVSCSHSEKQASPISITEGGMQIDLNDVHQENAPSARYCSRQFASKRQLDNRVQSSKQSISSSSTPGGIRTDSSPQPEKELWPMIRNPESREKLTRDRRTHNSKQLAGTISTNDGISIH
jgi:hypothetical protein